MFGGKPAPAVDPHYEFLLKDTSRDFVQVLFAGDAMQHDVQLTWAYDSTDKQYHYDANWRYLQPLIQKADINVVNLETTLSGAPYTGYPKFRTPDSYFTSLCDAGFEVFTLANNHILDGGRKGLERTLDQIGQVAHCGAYRDTSYRAKEYPLILTCAGIKIALFNATYGTNQLFPTVPNYVNYIETEELLLDMEKSKLDTSIDLRVIYIHWGDEYVLYHNPLQGGVAQWLADLGFDLIIGGHPHVVEDQSVLTSKDGRKVPVVYSLGNLISNQRRLNCNGGLIVTVNISRSTHKITQIDYAPVYVHKGLWGTEKDYFCLPTDDYLGGKLPYTLPSDSLENDLRLFHKNSVDRMGVRPVVVYE